MSLSEKIRAVGFCGVDESVSVELVGLLSSHYPWIEWGMLFRTDLQGTPRYASLEWVERLGNFRKNNPSLNLQLAGHLCGDQCENLFNGDRSFVAYLAELGFRRIQINPTAANNVKLDTTAFGAYAETIISTMESFVDIEWIFQLNTETSPIWEHILRISVPSNLSVLYDASCGRGVKIDHFPSPQQYASTPCGYAGGIGPKTIDEVLDKISSELVLLPTNRKVWVDMESSLRTIVQVNESTTTDIFDINKVMYCILAAAQRGLPVVGYR
jgi:hypothetical protein